jgi:crotonobetainyl-CoA:carnitine CoA-transferase CaiB-like acyl-CoA transferase
MSGFGSTGPYRDYVSYGPTLQAAAGHSLMMQSSGGAPTGWGFSYSDMVAGRTAAFAIIVALWHRQQTGKGQRIELSQLESLISVSGPLVLAAQVSAITQPPGNSSQEAAASPHGVYRCADRPADAPAHDRWCAIAVFGDDDWERFCRAIDTPAWTRDERFRSHAGRTRHRAGLDAAITSWTSSRMVEDVMHRLQRHGVAAGVVANAKDLCLRDGQLRHRGYWVPTLLPDGSIIPLDGSPSAASAHDDSSTPRPTPSTGQQTDAILSSILGLTREQIEELRRDAVVA